MAGFQAKSGPLFLFKTLGRVRIWLLWSGLRLGGLSNLVVPVRFSWVGSYRLVRAFVLDTCRTTVNGET